MHIFLSIATGEYRGYMKNCYHKSCDDMRHVTPERLQFLAITTHALKTLLLEVSAENKHCYRGGSYYILYITCSKAFIVCNAGRTGL